MRAHLACVPDQRRQQAIFVGREMHFVASAHDAPRRQVDLHVTETKHGVGRSLVARRTTQRDADARQELADAEGLGQVVVGARVERLDLFLLVAACGQDDDRPRIPLAQPCRHFHAVDVGQAQIEDDQIGLSRRCFDESVASRFGLEDPEWLRGQACAQEPPDLRIILDDDQRGRRFAHWSTSKLGRPVPLKEMHSRSGSPFALSRASIRLGRPVAIMTQPAPIAPSTSPRHGGIPAGSTNLNTAPPPARFAAMIVPPCAVDDRLADGEAEPDSALCRFRSAAIELVEEPRVVARRKTGPAVRDFDDDALRHRGRADVDRRIRRACTWPRSRAGWPAPARSAPDRR